MLDTHPAILLLCSDFTYNGNKSDAIAVNDLESNLHEENFKVLLRLPKNM